MVTASGGDLDEPIAKVVEVAVPGDNVKLDFIVTPDPGSHTLKMSVEGQGETIPMSGAIHTYEAGSEILFSAKPKLGWTFSYWKIGDQTITENPHKLVIEEDLSATAVFTEEQAPFYRLVIAVEGSGTTDPAPGTVEVENGQIQVEAKPDEGNTFVEWMLNGETQGDDNPLDLTIDDDSKLVAFFTEEIKEPITEEKKGDPISNLIEALQALIKQLLSMFGGG
jgi:hypothetical protein